MNAYHCAIRSGPFGQIRSFVDVNAEHAVDAVGKALEWALTGAGLDHESERVQVEVCLFFRAQP